MLGAVAGWNKIGGVEAHKGLSLGCKIKGEDGDESEGKSMETESEGCVEEREGKSAVKKVEEEQKKKKGESHDTVGDAVGEGASAGVGWGIGAWIGTLFDQTLFSKEAIRRSTHAVTFHRPVFLDYG